MVQLIKTSNFDKVLKGTKLNKEKYEELYKESIENTSRVIIAYEDNLTNGFGAEISAIISENFFEILDAPVIRVASLDTPVPFSADIERDIYLPLSRIKDKINYLLDY